MDDQRANRESGSNLRTAEEMLDFVTEYIAYMHKRPEMYIDSTTAPHSASALEIAMWAPHIFWAELQHRRSDFHAACQAVGEIYNCGTRGFCNAFREDHPGCSDAEVFEFVQKCWREISDRLHIKEKNLVSEKSNPTT